VKRQAIALTIRSMSASSDSPFGGQGLRLLKKVTALVRHLDDSPQRRALLLRLRGEWRI
jgi:hypothetical protein